MRLAQSPVHAPDRVAKINATQADNKQEGELPSCVTGYRQVLVPFMHSTN